jgi:hypothetical protein
MRMCVHIHSCICADITKSLWGMVKSNGSHCHSEHREFDSQEIFKILSYMYIYIYIHKRERERWDDLLLWLTAILYLYIYIYTCIHTCIHTYIHTLLVYAVPSMLSMRMIYTTAD